MARIGAWWAKYYFCISRDQGAKYAKAAGSALYRTYTEGLVQDVSFAGGEDGNERRERNELMADMVHGMSGADKGSFEVGWEVEGHYVRSSFVAAIKADINAWTNEDPDNKANWTAAMTVGGTAEK